MWSINLVKCGQMWSNVIKSGRIWSNVVESGRLRFFMETRFWSPEMTRIDQIVETRNEQCSSLSSAGACVFFSGRWWSCQVVESGQIWSLEVVVGGVRWSFLVVSGHSGLRWSFFFIWSPFGAMFPERPDLTRMTRFDQIRSLLTSWNDQM